MLQDAPSHNVEKSKRKILNQPPDPHQHLIGSWKFHRVEYFLHDPANHKKTQPRQKHNLRIWGHKFYIGPKQNHLEWHNVWVWPQDKNVVGINALKDIFENVCIHFHIDNYMRRLIPISCVLH